MATGSPHSAAASKIGKIARLAVGPVGAPAKKHLDEALVLGHTPDLRRGRLRVLRRAEDRGAEARLFGEPPLAEPLVVGPCELGRAVRARHQGDENRVVPVQDPDLGAARVEQLAADRVHVGCRRVAVLLDVRSKPGGGVYPGVAGDPERRALPAEPLALGGIDVAEEVLDVPDLRVDVAVDHEEDDSPPNMSFSTEDWLPWLGDFLKRRGLPGMAVAVDAPGRRLEFAAEVGWAELRKRPIESETLFELGSIGKTFTALLATSCSTCRRRSPTTCPGSRCARPTTRSGSSTCSRTRPGSSVART